MQILYASTLYSEKKFKEIFNKSKIKPQQQSQKFHKLLSKGLANEVNNVMVMSPLPNVKMLSKYYKDEENNIKYKYISTKLWGPLKYFYVFYKGLLSSIKWALDTKKNERFIISDVLILTNSLSAFIASKIFRIKTVAIVTDIPNYMINYSGEKKSPFKLLLLNIYSNLCNYFMYKYDHYIVLTEQMNEIVNPNKKSYTVIEGLVDINMKEIKNDLYEKHLEKVVMYTGALYEKYGIKNLLEAFMILEIEDARLWIYGQGDMIDEIKEYEKKDSRIKYFGVVANEKIVKEQLKATILVNPRPSTEEFTKYSFPSKNMEYMVSGTPVITTPLPGMPLEYKEFVHIFEDESIIGLSNTLKNVLQMDKEELHEKGLNAKKFVLNKKNNYFQAKKLINDIY